MTTFVNPASSLRMELFLFLTDRVIGLLAFHFYKLDDEYVGPTHFVFKPAFALYRGSPGISDQVSGKNIQSAQAEF